MAALRRKRGTGEARETFQPRLYLKLGALLLVGAYVIAFVIENHKQVSVDFVFASARVSLIWMMLLLLALGVLWGVVLSQLYRHRRRRKERGEPRDAIPDLGGRDEAVGKAGSAPPS